MFSRNKILETIYICIQHNMVVLSIYSKLTIFSKVMHRKFHVVANIGSFTIKYGLDKAMLRHVS